MYLWEVICVNRNPDPSEPDDTGGLVSFPVVTEDDTLGSLDERVQAGFPRGGAQILEARLLAEALGAPGLGLWIEKEEVVNAD